MSRGNTVLQHLASRVQTDTLWETESEDKRPDKGI